MQIEIPNLLLTRREAAERLRMSTRTLAKLIDSGEGPNPVRVSPGKVMFKPADLSAWVDSRVDHGAGGVR